MSPNPDTLRGLLADFRAGDVEAGSRLLRHYEAWLKLLARTQMESRFQAKFDVSDVVQQALLEAVKAFPQFRGHTDGEFATWLRQILAHVLAHEVRRYAGTGKRDIAKERSLDETLGEAAQRLGDILAATGTSPTQRLVQQERQQLLARALEQLPEDYRDVLILRHLEGLSHEEIARRMGRNPGAVRMLWVRALADLRREIRATRSA
jgi:RNA polymerase sigma-70 factor (ECF subfamily)